ncbi:hypothetical protein CFIO01_06287 [Colletotrichum fioriniae PJ7]|uniref:Uncharacterized protein n=1 Tax=Colletotrichum fioriniae PJ7 TaxID=1445577 RepID=A0A010R5R7_9PEZI|nr:hypothetical protein CFIO01_06287 [Colletotrichum fioriniae PJ7]
MVAIAKRELAQGGGWSMGVRAERKGKAKDEFIRHYQGLGSSRTFAKTHEWLTEPICRVSRGKRPDRCAEERAGEWTRPTEMGLHGSGGFLACIAAFLSINQRKIMTSVYSRWRESKMQHNPYLWALPESSQDAVQEPTCVIPDMPC